MIEEVLEFINRRWGNSGDTFLYGNCYWFARILMSRFFYLSIYYLPVEGHFVAGFGGRYFDVTGEVTTNNPILALSEIKSTDYDWYDRLMKDCRD